MRTLKDNIVIKKIIQASFFIVISTLTSTANEKSPEKDLFSLSLEELLQIKVNTLTTTNKLKTPSAYTEITQNDIKNSGARSLDELLLIYVPGLQRIYHHSNLPHLGLRGHINDRDDAYIVTVNGKVMNQRTALGAMTERDLVLLSDIEKVELIRGPGSAIFGLGAISMVIAITTFDGESFSGTEANLGASHGLDLYRFNIKHSLDISDKASLFLYGGYAVVHGANSSKSPYKFGTSFTSAEGPVVTAGEDANTLLPHDGEAYRGRDPIKLHAHLNMENSNIWLRYTRGGGSYANRIINVAAPPFGRKRPNVDISDQGYQQATLSFEHKQNFSNKLQFQYRLSYDLLDFDKYVWFRSNAARRQESMREDEYSSRFIANYRTDKDILLAGGFEFSREEFGLKGLGSSDRSPITQVYQSNMPRWSASTFSPLYEIQWDIAEDWTTFIGGRLDRHSQAESSFSPRAALIYTPSIHSSLKLIWARSSRLNTASELNEIYENGSKSKQAERIDNIELRHEMTHSDKLNSAIGVYHQDIRLIGYDRSTNERKALGDLRSAGAEVELNYSGQDYKLQVSHVFSKLSSLELSPGIVDLLTVSASPNGFGNDFDSWSNHITKFYLDYEINKKWNFHANSQYLWGFPGIQDMIEYRNSKRTSGQEYTEPGRKDASKQSVFLSMGVKYSYSKNSDIQLSGHHLLGLFDDDLNKQNYLGGYGGYRNLAPSVSLNLNLRYF